MMWNPQLICQGKGDWGPVFSVALQPNRASVP